MSTTKTPRISKAKAKQFVSLISGSFNPPIEYDDYTGIWSARVGHMRFDFWIIQTTPEHIYCQILHFNECIHAVYYHLETLEPDHRLTFEKRSKNAEE